jgi:serine/threonine protein kinase
MEEQFIGNYKILKKIGAGGMARVYLAVHKDVPNLKVVLKILTNPSLVERFRQEADKLALLDGHPNICRIKHFFNHGDDFVIAMEYIDGVTLDDMIKDDRKIPIGEAARIMVEVLDILNAAHEKEIYHRDIKPSNIMIDKKGNVKIIDFGIAKGKSDPNLTIAGTACGTPAYMAPEQFSPTADINYAYADIYAAGVTLYRLITGQLPFKGQNEFAIRDAKMFTEPTKPRSISSEIPKDLEAIILKSMKKAPGERYSTALEMKKAIAPFVTRQDKAETEKSVAAKKESIDSGEKGRSKLIPILAAIIGVIVIVVLILKFLPSEEKKNVVSSSDSISTNTGLQDTGLTIANINDTTSTAAAPKGSINLTIRPTGDVYINNDLMARDKSSYLARLDTGLTIVRVENNKAMEKELVDTIALANNATVNREYVFHIPTDTQIAKPPVKSFGTVLVGSHPKGGDIYIDDELREEKTPYSFRLPAGKHVIRVEVDNEGEMMQKTYPVEITRNDTVRIIFDANQ